MRKYLVLPIIFLLLISFSSSVSAKSKANSKVYYKDKIIVLMYHHIEDMKKGEDHGTATIPVELFEKHMDMLKREKFNVIPIEDINYFIKGYKEIPPNSVVITFDDGYESFYNYAYPELVKKNFSATSFVIVSTVGKTNVGIPKLNWEQILEMREKNMSFYSHTYDSHYQDIINPAGKKAPILAKPLYNKDNNKYENNYNYKRRIYNDLNKSKGIIEKRVGIMCKFLCYPYGASSKVTEEVAKSIGYDFAFTIKPGVCTKNSNRFRIPRVNAGNPKITPDMLKKNILKYAKENN